MLARLRSRTHIGHPTRLRGYWEFPSSIELVGTGDLDISGWALGDGPALPTVTLFRNGLPIGRQTASIHRADLDEAIADGDVGGGWHFMLRSSPSGMRDRIDVIVSTDRTSLHLGTRVLIGQPLDQEIRGAIDSPRDGQVVYAGSALPVFGWMLFGERPADTVEVCLGDRDPIRVRRAIPRADVFTALGASDPSAIAAGFGELIPISPELAGQDIPLYVKAAGQDGAMWFASDVTIRVEQRSVSGAVLGAPLEHPPRRRLAQSGSSALRVCIFTHSLALGGGQLYLHELVTRLARDHPVDMLVVSPVDGPLRADLEAVGVAVHITHHYPVSEVYYQGRVNELALIIEAFNADVVLVNTLGVFPAVEAALQLHLPVFWAVHESFDLDVFAVLNWGESGLHPAIRQRWINCLSEAEVIFESHATRVLFEQMVPQMHSRNLRYGIDLIAVKRYCEQHDRNKLRKELEIGQGSRVLLCMGIFEERKSQLALVVAFEKLATIFPQAVLVLVGNHDSPYARSVTEAAGRLRMADRLRILPVVPDTYNWYRTADILVSCSDVESLPRSVLEAQAFGVPVLAADVFGLSEVVRDGQNGWLFPPRDGGSLIAALRRVFAVSDDELSAMKEQCLIEATKYDAGRFAAEYFSLLASACSWLREDDLPRFRSSSA